MRTFWLIAGCVAFSVLSLMLMRSEAGFNVTFVVMIACWALFARGGFRVALVSIGVLGLAVQMSTYKVYGRAQIVQTAPLPGARVVTALEPPSLLRFADGGTAKLASVYFPREIKLDEVNGLTTGFHFFAGHRGKVVPTSVQMKGDGGADFQRRQVYWCGNTFFPTFFPSRLPSHETVDFGRFLISSGLALPVIDEGGADLEKENEALALLENAREFTDESVVLPGDKYAINLGRHLATPNSRHFVAGAFLLIAAQDTDSYPQIIAEVRRRKAVNRRDYDAVAQSRSESLDHLLEMMDPNWVKPARKLHVDSETQKFGDEMMQLVWNAANFAKAGDLSACDAAFRDWKDGHYSDVQARDLIQFITRYFRWPPRAQGFHEWYAHVRPQLHAREGGENGLEFWLEGGKPFDQRYQESMEPFAGSARKP